MWVVFSLIIYSMVLHSFDLIDLQVHNEYWKIKSVQIETLHQAHEIIPPFGQVIVIGNPGLREWSPYLLQREILNTEFGLEWQPDEYRQIMAANQVLATAENWESIIGAVRSLTDQEQVYVILDPNQISASLGVADQSPFLVKMKTSELEVGLLELR